MSRRVSRSPTWMGASSALPCPYCSCLASRSHQLKCQKRPMTCDLCHTKNLTAASMSAHQQCECPMRRGPCPGCGEQVLSVSMQDHIMGGSCKARTFTCQSCEAVFWIGEEYVRHALPRCERSVVPCQLCGHAVSTSILAEHYQTCAAMMLSEKHRGSIGRASLASSSKPNDRDLASTPEAKSQGLWRSGSPGRHGSNLAHADALLIPAGAVTRGAPGGPLRTVSRSPLRTSPARLRASLHEASASPMRSTQRRLHHSADVSPPPSRSSSACGFGGARAASNTPPQSAEHWDPLISISPSSTGVDGVAELSTGGDGGGAKAVLPRGGGDITVENDPTANDGPTAQGGSQTRIGVTHGEMCRPRATSASHQNRSSFLRHSASQVRMHGGPASLAAKDRRQHALSDQIRRREDAQAGQHHLAPKPQLPSFVSQPLSPTVSTAARGRGNPLRR